MNQVEWDNKYIYYPIYRFVKHHLHLRWFKWGYEYCRNGFSSQQLWSLDHTCTDFILPRLIAFRNGKGNSHKDGPSGCPILDGYGDENGSMSADEDAAMYQEWLDILDKMILAFDYHQRDSDDIDFGKIEMRTDDSSGKNQVTIDKDDAQWDIGREEETNRQQKMEESFALFAKYYQALWD